MRIGTDEISSRFYERRYVVLVADPVFEAYFDWRDALDRGSPFDSAELARFFAELNANPSAVARVPSNVKHARAAPRRVHHVRELLLTRRATFPGRPSCSAEAISSIGLPPKVVSYPFLSAFYPRECI
jgi:hypothetical protein